MAKRKRGAPSLAEAGNLIVKKAPRGMSKRMTYFARPSFEKGITPTHLAAHAQRFKEQAPKCAATLKGMPYGPEHPKALRACIGQALSSGGKRSRAGQ